MSDSDLPSSRPLSPTNIHKRRRPQYDSETSTPARYRSPSSDELAGDATMDRRDTSRRPRLGNGENVVARGEQDRSPSRDELDHTFYGDEDVQRSRHRGASTPATPRSQRSRDSSRARYDKAEDRTPSPMEDLPTRPVKEVKYREKMTLKGHSKGVSQVRFSPDGRWIASCSADATIKVWDASTGKLSQTLEGHLAGISTIAWSPDSKTIASGSDDKKIRLWNRATGKPYLSPLLGHHNYVFSVAFSPKGNMLASGSYDEAVFLWDVRAGRQMRSLPAHSDPVGGVDFVRDGTLVVSCATDGLIRIWDTATGQCLRTIVHKDNPPVTTVQFSPNGKYVLAWTLDGCIRLWDYVEGLCKKTYQGHINRKYSLGGTFGVCGTEAFIVSGSEDGRLIFWDVKSKHILQILDGHKNAVLWADTHPTRDLIATCGLDGLVKVWTNEDEVEKTEDEGLEQSVLEDTSLTDELKQEAEESAALPNGMIDMKLNAEEDTDMKEDTESKAADEAADVEMGDDGLDAHMSETNGAGEEDIMNYDTPTSALPIKEEAV